MSRALHCAEVLLSCGLWYERICPCQWWMSLWLTLAVLLTGRHHSTSIIVIISDRRAIPFLSSSWILHRVAMTRHMMCSKQSVHITEAVAEELPELWPISCCFLHALRYLTYNSLSKSQKQKPAESSFPLFLFLLTAVKFERKSQGRTSVRSACIPVQHSGGSDVVFGTGWTTTISLQNHR